ncbi:MAG: ROK family transcriptional regulator [Eubacteriales bacterium]|nr:ROK family transcriptional regulator [Eubacteriales bacterium]
MPETFTPAQLKEQNKQHIYQLIYNRRRISLQDIAYELHLSRPTVTGKLNELEAEGLIQKEGLISSELAGRKASAYTIVSDYRVAVGVDLGPNNFSIAIINLYGELLDHTTLFLDFEDTETYYQKASELIQNFVQSLCHSPEQVLGIGFSLSPGSRKPSLTSFRKHLAYTVTFISDADSGAISWLWHHPEISDAVYISLSYHLSTARIQQGAIFTGIHGHGTRAEHICIDPSGKKCFCGRTGCLETICALSELLTPEEELSQFIQQVRGGEASYKERFQMYLQALSKAIDTLRLVSDIPCVLGGTMGNHLSEEDLDFLYAECDKALSAPEAKDYLRIHSPKPHSLAMGAALPFIWGFL